ncbi:major facilitator superfamily domain-containing protein [Sporodiniella umbellata]|nr:major facilitator superfamily domain-containing protein [Sporodiniella umbellata]
MNCQEQIPLLTSNITHWRWFILFSCSLLTFSSAIAWSTFSPCVYIFTDYYFEQVNGYTINAINMLSSIYMLVYPCLIYWVVQSFLKSKDGHGLTKIIAWGAFLNAFGCFLRWLGSFPSPTGFMILFSGQTVAAIAQVFFMTLIPQLVVAWFPLNEVNLATSIAITANGLGVGIGCAFTPLIVKKTTAIDDIPQLLFIQLILSLLALMLIWISFKKPSPYFTTVYADFSVAKIWKQKTFMYLLGVFGITAGGQCAIVSLLAQILLPPFGHLLDEQHVGLLGAMTVIIGSIGTIWAGYYLDKTRKYVQLNRLMCWISAFTIFGLLVAIEFNSIFGSVIACIGFGLASCALIPTTIQFACEMLYPISDIIPTAYLLSASNMSGTLLVALMSSVENANNKFSMRTPIAFLLSLFCVAILLMYQVKGDLNRTSQKQLLPF